MATHFIARLLRNVHAGEKRLAWNYPAVASAPSSIRLTSSVFAPGAAIPQRYAGEGVGQNISPDLSWSQLPEGTVELVLVMEDPDVPLPRPFVHLIATAIKPTLASLPEGALSAQAPFGGILFGYGTTRHRGYAGPRALPGHGPHRYVFELFALNRQLQFATPPALSDLLRAMHGAVIARGRLDGIFEQK
jgi:Raf kinase inhibitor-like protein, YbhB/YbcL family